MSTESHLSDHAKNYIRLNGSRMPVSMMAKFLAVKWYAVDSFMKSEGIENKLRKKKDPALKADAGRITRMKKKPVAEGMFNVYQHENWIM